MITGVKPWRGAQAEPADGRTWLAALIAGLAALAVYFLVRSDIVLTARPPARLRTG